LDTLGNPNHFKIKCDSLSKGAREIIKDYKILSTHAKAVLNYYYGKKVKKTRRPSSEKV